MMFITTQRPQRAKKSLARDRCVAGTSNTMGEVLADELPPLTLEEGYEERARRC